MAQYPAQLLVGPLNGEPVPCTLESLDDDVARIRMDAGASLEPTSAAAMWLCESPGGTAVVLPVVAGWTETVDGHEVLELFFSESGAPSALWDETRVGRDRRSEVRIAPAEGEVEVWLDAKHGDIQVSVVDVSAGGMCIDIAPDLIPETPFAEAFFQVLLPGEVWPFVLYAKVRHRRRQSVDRVRLGLEFDPMRSCMYDVQTARISAWIGRRRQEVAAMVLRD